VVFTDPEVLPPFLTYSSRTFTGSSISTAHLGEYTINFVTDLYPYDRSEETPFSVIVTCVQQAPVMAPTSLTFEIGITSSSLPYTLTTFTQTA
jgi:hypothetical protein